MAVAPWTRLNGWMGLDISRWGEVYGKGAYNFSDVASILFTEFKTKLYLTSFRLPSSCTAPMKFFTSGIELRNQIEFLNIETLMAGQL